MEIYQLNETQYGLMVVATEGKALIQIHPDPALDKPEIYAEWKHSVDTRAKLLELGLLTESSMDGDPVAEKLKQSLPNRKFSKFVPTKLGYLMFGDCQTRTIQ